jgi:hypothetical protein
MLWLNGLTFWPPGQGPVCAAGELMPLILGIYHKQGALSPGAVQPMVDAFGGFAHRYLTRKEFPGLLFVSANEKEGETVFSSDGTAAFVGTLGVALGELGHGQKASRPVADDFLEAWKRGTETLEGAFVGAVYDPSAHRLALINDRFGMRPLFICETRDYVGFCNELEPLLRTPGFQFELDTSAIAAFFCLGTTLGEQTFVKGIRNLPPGSVFEVDPMKRDAACGVAGPSVGNGRIWNDLPIDRSASIEQHAHRITAILKTVVVQMMDQLTNVRCLLSAGADSRLILSCMPPEQRQRVPWLTSNLSILPPEEDKDVIGAQALAARLGLDHEVLPIAFSELDFGTGYFDQVRNNRWKKIVGGWHGGEFLGGFCSLAAPIRRTLTYKEVDETLRNLFSWRFRRRLEVHPFELYQAALTQATPENRDFHFQIQQFGRSFFTNIYRGSRGNWLQPYEIINQRFSPFWDSRFLETLLQVPFEMVAGYQLYNVIFRDCLRELTDIPSNSPLTLRADSALPRMTAGTDPKVALKPKYQTALDLYAADRATWQRRIYRKRRMRKGLLDGDAPITMQFIDFEAWLRRYGPIR